MAVDVIMPQMGESVTEGTIVRWLKAVGDAVDRDETIYEITTDKVDAEIPAPAAGVLLEIKVAAGETVAVDTVVAVIGQAGEQTAAAGATPKSGQVEAAPVAAAPATTAAPAEAASARATPATNKPRAEMSAAELRATRSTPVVRRIAKEHGITDLGPIPGSGLDGRVTRKDIEAWIAAGKHTGAAAGRPASTSVGAAVGRVEMGVPMKPVPPRPGDRIEPMSKMRRTISDRMIESKGYSAHVHTCFEVDYGRVNTLRRKYKALYAERGGRLTFTTFLARAAVETLQQFPVVNSAHDGENVIYRGDINLGIAVALDWGLLVPVVKHADDLSMLGLSKQIADMGARARSKRLQPDELAGLSFSITNPGIFGSLWGTPIIPQPSAAILGVGTIEKRAKVVTLADGTDSLAIKLCGYLTLGFDHRVIDGATADQFMSHLKKTLESFDESAM